MMERFTRVALFADCFNEVNGVSNTCRQFVEFARVHGLPLLLVAADEETSLTVNGSVTRLGLKRGSVSFGVDKDLRFDLMFMKHYRQIREEVRTFAPDVVHITGPGDVGIAGATTGHDLGVPVAGSWHTNLHEYAARRSAFLLPAWLNEKTRRQLLQKIEDASFQLAAFYFRVARFHFAPNRELIERLSATTGRPCYLMERGVDQEAFHPRRRTRGDDGKIVIGYVGRLTAEKQVRRLAKLADALLNAGFSNFKIVFVGQGGEREWLAQNVRNAEFTGVLRGPELAAAYANMDIFAFPSDTDTFGNVVLEALASGVPAVVTSRGGPKFIVEQGRSGLVADGELQFIESVQRLVKDRSLRLAMSAEARARALRASWHAVFEEVYRVYEAELSNVVKGRKLPGGVNDGPGSGLLRMAGGGALQHARSETTIQNRSWD
jgi:glycosyltransferase involved in cell wall biosynthesis